MTNKLPGLWEEEDSLELIEYDYEQDEYAPENSDLLSFFDESGGYDE